MSNDRSRNRVGEIALETTAATIATNVQYRSIAQARARPKQGTTDSCCALRAELIHQRPHRARTTRHSRYATSLRTRSRHRSIPITMAQTPTPRWRRRQQQLLLLALLSMSTLAPPASAAATVIQQKLYGLTSGLAYYTQMNIGQPLYSATSPSATVRLMHHASCSIARVVLTHTPCLARTTFVFSSTRGPQTLRS